MSVLNQTYNPPSGCFGFCSEAAEGTSAGNPIFNHRPLTPVEDRHLATEDRKKKQEWDDLLSEAMRGLSFQERQKQQDVLHGVEEIVTEDQTILDRALQDLDFHLKLTKEGSVYEVAERMDPEYVSARAFRVMFLRANDYDPSASADQMLRFFNLKNELFGTEKLTKDITIDDLDDGDIDCLKLGWLQLLGKDRSGRAVLLYVGGLFGELSTSLKSDLRVQYFIVMKALESEETQLRGTISLWYAMGDYRAKPDGRRYFDIFMATKVFPRKKAAIHFCVDEIRQPFVSTAILKVMKGTLRARLRLHFGSPMECQYQLSTYGIPSEYLAVEVNGRLNLDRHLQWVQSCTTNRPILLEDEPNCSGSTPKDVLFTGTKVSYNEGNQKFLALVQDYSQVYDSGNLRSKRQVVDEIIDKIHQSGGRFLRRQNRSSTVWEEVPLGDLRKKVTQSFRNRRRRRTVTSNKQNNTNDCDDNVMMASEQDQPACGVDTLLRWEQQKMPDVVDEVPSNEPLLLDCNIQPNPNDVIFTGKKNPKHVGNQRYLSLVQEFSQVYDGGTDESKREVVNNIIHMIHEAGGRFLKQDGSDKSSWKEVSHKELRKKTMQAFRNRRRHHDASKK